MGAVVVQGEGLGLIAAGGARVGVHHRVLQILQPRPGPRCQHSLGLASGVGAHLLRVGDRRILPAALAARRLAGEDPASNDNPAEPTDTAAPLMSETPGSERAQGPQPVRWLPWRIRSRSRSRSHASEKGSSPRPPRGRCQPERRQRRSSKSWTWFDPCRERHSLIAERPAYFWSARTSSPAICTTRRPREPLANCTTSARPPTCATCPTEGEGDDGARPESR